MHATAKPAFGPVFVCGSVLSINGDRLVVGTVSRSNLESPHEVPNRKHCPIEGVAARPEGPFGRVRPKDRKLIGKGAFREQPSVTISDLTLGLCMVHNIEKLARHGYAG